MQYFTKTCVINVGFVVYLGNMKYKILLVSCLFVALSSLFASAQTTTELKAFENAAGNGSVLFRGKQANPYQHAANGNPYWSSTTFVPAEIVFEGRLYDDVLVNIDAITGQVLVRKDGSPIAIALPVGSVSTITTESGHFELVPDGVEGIPEGLYEILGDGGQKVYKHVKKQLKTGAQNMNGEPIGYVDPGYRSDVHDYYAISRTYYFKDLEGRFSRIRNKRDLVRKFPERRSEIRKAVSASGYELQGAGFDRYCISVLNLVAR